MNLDGSLVIPMTS